MHLWPSIKGFGLSLGSGSNGCSKSHRTDLGFSGSTFTTRVSLRCTPEKWPPFAEWIRGGSVRAQHSIVQFCCFKPQICKFLVSTLLLSQSQQWFGHYTMRMAILADLSEKCSNEGGRYSRGSSLAFGALTQAKCRGGGEAERDGGAGRSWCHDWASLIEMPQKSDWWHRWTSVVDRGRSLDNQHVDHWLPTMKIWFGVLCHWRSAIVSFAPVCCPKHPLASLSGQCWLAKFIRSLRPQPEAARQLFQILGSEF